MTALIILALIALGGILISVLQNDIAVSVFQSAFGMDMIDSVVQILHVTNTDLISTTNTSTGYYGIINASFEAIKPLGYALITTYFIMRIIDLASADGLSFDTLIKSLIQLVLVFTVASNSSTIINAILSVGESALTSVYTSLESYFSLNADGINDLATDFAGETFAVIMAIELLFVFLAHIAVVVAIDIAAITRLIDIGWRAALMPVGIANCFSNGSGSAGMTYIKGFIGSVLSGAVMLIVIAIGMTISCSIVSASGMISSATLRAFCAIAAQLATVGAATGIPARMREVIG